MFRNKHNQICFDDEIRSQVELIKNEVDDDFNNEINE